MRNKRKAVSNNMARDMPMDGLHSFASDGASNHQPATSVSHGILDGSVGHYTGPTVMHDAAFSGGIVGGGLGSFHSNVVLPATLGTLTTALETLAQAGQQVCVMPVQTMVPAHVSAMNQSPAQAITVDGLVSIFTPANIMPDPLLCYQSRLPTEGSATVLTQLPNNTLRDYAPMVLDFSAGEVLQNHVPAESSSNGRPTLSRGRMPARRRSHARGMRTPLNTQHAQPGGMRAPLNTQHAQPGHSRTDDMNATPTQGPLAPPESRGAPLDYKRFGLCDKWEERRTGLPASAAPQYQKCCAGGCVALTAYGEYPGYIVDLYSDRHFVDNIRAYNQMFEMTSFGATIDGSVNVGGAYVFRVSGQIYHWIGGFCPSEDDTPRFLHMYVYDTDHEIQHRLSHFDPHERHALREDIVEGLIEFLIENNALVHLFRTARDKLQEADISEFQIRLFGVIGANQYELPTADAIGAIVYDGGPESMTEKMALTGDVNTQSTTAVPADLQRSLAYFTDLNPADNSKFIEARVYRKWTSMKIPALIPTGFSCILLDKKGTAIQANSDLKEKERLERDLQLNCVYRIQGFGFEKTDGWGKTLDIDMTLCFGKHTQVDLLKDADYPYHYFNFAAYNELGSRLEKKNPILTNYIGYIHNVEKVKEFGGATGNKIKLRNIGIRNLNTSTPQLEVQTEKLTEWEQERTRNRVALGTLLQIDPNTQQTPRMTGTIKNAMNVVGN
ncbi:hypothetical protein CTI12_AA465000 [Artemisia annua]|uniref:Helitron helicase-like domain-containing protein n=1 Tax=Artemisia annua TaxID=35608 RepID=A0A2U1LQX5_ARTAN|nr:hypothetical protein CTI12_AA465000 [Artemisia annua]